MIDVYNTHKKDRKIQREGETDTSLSIKRLVRAYGITKVVITIAKVSNDRSHGPMTGGL